MSVELKLTAEKRTDTGRGASRRLRHAKRVPAILYGAGKDAVMLSVERNELQRLMEQEAFYSQILTIEIGKKKEQAVLKDMQRHPFKPLVQHLDLQRIKAGEIMHAHVPLHFLNEDKSKGVKAGGVVHHDMIEVEIACLPKDLPEYIEVDIADLEVGEAIHLSQLKVPAAVELSALAHDEGHEHDHPVVSINLPRVARAEEEEGEEEATAADEVPTASDEEEGEGEGE